MSRIVSAQDIDGFLDPVRDIDVLDCRSRVRCALRVGDVVLTGDDGKRLIVPRIPQSNSRSGLQ